MALQDVDIRAIDRDVVDQILQSILPAGSQIWVFGSRARQDARRGSDLDLLIDAGRELLSDEEFELRLAFEESVLPFEVDVVDIASIDEHFLAAIRGDLLPWIPTTALPGTP